MSLVKGKYKELGPSIEFLTDVTVLAQAWKKTHTYIRQHNWYADVLELDISAFNLEDRLTEWASGLDDGTYKSAALRLVLAPKKRAWEFRDPKDEPTVAEIFDEDEKFHEWRPTLEEGSRQQPLRPLAHLEIRDQVLATAVMLCLANEVETSQGDPGLDTLTAHEQGVVSYGNRLYCSWREKEGRQRAYFSWGNSRSYSQYFQNYQSFLARPEGICRKLSETLPANRELYVVSLDLKSFFNHIDRANLLDTLRSLYPDDSEAENQKKFWTAAGSILNWHWDKHDEEALAAFCDISTDADTGLPQGLMASGFLANAFMLDFDQTMVGLYQETNQGDIQVHDYCRYVDDIRLVISTKKNGTSARAVHEIGHSIEDKVQELLDKNFKTDLKQKASVELNKEKTEVQPYYAISKHGRISALMKSINSDMSSPLDTESLRSLAGGLEGLLALAGQLSKNDNRKSSLALSAISVPKSDVRDDTVKRFVVSRMANTMRDRLAMADPLPSSGIAGINESAKSLAHEFEAAARGFIEIWAENPSLVLLLKTGMDLFPHPKLICPVLEAIELKIDPTLSGEEYQSQVKTAYYIVADILKAGAVETGYRNPCDYPETSDISGYRSELKRLAKKLLKDDEAPWYVKQQAYLFLASIHDLSRSGRPKTCITETENYRKLIRALRFCDVEPEELFASLPIMLVAQQIKPDSQGFVHWLSQQFSEVTDEQLLRDAFNSLTVNAPHLVLATLVNGSSHTLAKKYKRLAPKELRELASAKKNQSQSLNIPRELSLLKAMTRTPNPFQDENSLLALAEAILVAITAKKDDPDSVDELAGPDTLANGATPSQIHLSCTDWHRVSSLADSALSVSIEPASESYTLYQAPSWVNDDKQWLYGFGRLLRAAFTGEVDFSSRQYVLQEDRGHYSGLRSSWFQRRFGLMNHSRGLVSEPSPVSPWLSGFLTALLQWPGIALSNTTAQEVSEASSPRHLLDIVRERIKVQRQLYGERTQTPFYVLPTSDRAPEKRPMRVVVVQPMRPRLSEIDTKDPLHWTPREMAEHRRHLAEISKLVRAQVLSWRSALDASEEETAQTKPIVDLILFPELSVHPEHVSILRALSDALGATIFAGLTFIKNPSTGDITNQGLWLVRTEHESDGRRHEYIWQGKKFPMKAEIPMGVKSYRPHITLVEFPIGDKEPTRVSAAICYDATDLDLVADLRERSDVFLVAALNKDVQTFDNMVSALHYHMYQPVILANSGEFGGSTAQAPYPKFERLIAHVHGGNQVAVSVFEVEPWHFKSIRKSGSAKEVKTAPAGFNGRPV